MVLIRGNASFDVQGTTNNKVSKFDGKLNLSNVTKANSFIENTGSDVNKNQKKQIVSSVFETPNTIYVQGFSHLVEGERMAAQYSGSVPSVGVSQASEVLDANTVENLKEAFQNNLRKFEASNPRQWLNINNHAPLMESIVGETNKDNTIFESETEKYLVRLDYKIDVVKSDGQTSFTYTKDDVQGSANVDDIETTMFLVVDKYVKDGNGKWIYDTSSLANEIVTEFPTKGDFTTTINGEEIYIGTIKASVDDPRNKDINGLDITDINFDKELLDDLKSGNTIGTTSSLNENTIYRIINGNVFGPNVDMSRRTLRNIELSNIDLNGANFKDSKFINVKSSNVRGTPILPDGYNIINGYIVGSFVNLENAVLSDGDFKGMNLSGANLTGANLNRITSGNVTHDENTKLPENYKIVNGWIVGPNVVLNYEVDFTSVDLSGVSFYQADVQYANFTDSNLSGTILEGGDFSNANLSGIKSGNIQGGDIEKATIVKLPENYMFSNGYILGPGVNLDGADLTEVDFSLSRIYNLKLKNIIGTPILPIGYMMIAGFVVGKYMDFSNEDLTKLDFSELDVSDSIFTGANITGLNLKDTTMNNVVSGDIEQTRFFGGYVLANGVLIGPGLVFNGARLGAIDLTGIRFDGSQGVNIIGIPKLSNRYKLINQTIVGRNVVVTGANFKFSDLSEIDLRGVKSGKILANETKLPENYKIIGGYILGPEVTLTDADLRDLDLSQTILQGVVSGNVRTNANTRFPPGYKEVLGYIVGKDVNLTGANLQGLDLRDVDMSNAILLGGVTSGNILSNEKSFLPTNYVYANGVIVGPEVILGDADMRDAVLTGAYLKLVDFSKVIVNEGTVFPKGYVYEKNTLIGPGLVLDGVDFSDLDLRAVSLEFVRASNIKSNEQTQLPIGAGLIDGHIITRNADLRGADLSSIRGIKFPNPDKEFNTYIQTYHGTLTDSYDFYVHDKRLFNVKTTGLITDRTTILPKYVTLFRRNILLGINHDLSEGDFSYANCDNLRFVGNNLSRANFTSSKIDKMNAIGDAVEPVNVIALYLPQGISVEDKIKLAYDYANYEYEKERKVVFDDPENVFGFDDYTGNDKPNWSFSIYNTKLTNLNLTNVEYNFLSAPLVFSIPFPWGENQFWEITDPDHYNYRGEYSNGLIGSSIVGGVDYSEYDWGSMSNLFKNGFFSNYRRSTIVEDNETNFKTYAASIGRKLITIDLPTYMLSSITTSIFRNVDFTGYYFDNISFDNCDFSNSNFNNAKIGSTLATQSSQIGGTSFSVINETKYKDCVFENVDFTDARFANVKFEECYFFNCNMSNVKFYNTVDFETSIFNGVKMGKNGFNTKDANISLPDKYELISYNSDDSNTIIVGPYMDLSIVSSMFKYNISTVNLTGVNLSGANFDRSNLREANLKGANLKGANLYGANLYGANLSGANLYGAKLLTTYLENANLSRADLSGADLSGADLKDADLTDAILTDVVTDENTIGPDGTKGWNPN